MELPHLIIKNNGDPVSHVVVLFHSIPLLSLHSLYFILSHTFLLLPSFFYTFTVSFITYCFIDIYFPSCLFIITFYFIYNIMYLIIYYNKILYYIIYTILYY